MTRALVRCDGAAVPSEVSRSAWDMRHSVHHRGSDANQNLSIQSPSHTLLTAVTDRATDFLRLASYVYAADQLVRRGGDGDVYGDRWEREFAVCLPVSDPDFWSDPRIARLLGDTLSFVSGDRWHFYFSPASPAEGQLAFEIDPNASLGDPNAVFLFSGGMDSLCAVVESAIVHGKRPLLVGHSPAFHIATRQRELARALWGRLGGHWHFPYLSVAIHRTGSDAKEYSQRTRSFLYATIGAVIADRLGVSEVGLADNGVVSLNLPINEQLLGTKATRSTHPKFLRLFSELSVAVLPNGPRLVNPLWDRTRAEGIEVLKRANAAALLEQTYSCSHQRKLTAMRPHCGVCFQCIDRRFATIAARLEGYDPPDRYEVDVFRHDLKEGSPRTMAVSYYRFAAGLAELTDEGLFLHYPELLDCLDPSDSALVQRQMGEALGALLRRHGTSVLTVMETQIKRYGRELARRQLPELSLLRLVAAPDELAAKAGAAEDEIFSHSEDYTYIVIRKLEFTLTQTQATVIRILDEARLKGSPIIQWDVIPSQLPTQPASMRDVFRRVKNWQELVQRVGRSAYRLNL